jgi:hypothetical protein
MGTLLRLGINPLTLLSLLAGIVGGAWLAFLGQWSPVAAGIFVIFVGPRLVLIILGPHFEWSATSLALLLKGRRIFGLVFGCFGLLWLVAVGTLWCGGVLWAALQSTKDSGALLPTLIWSYAVACLPLSYMVGVEHPLLFLRTGIHINFFFKIGYAVTILTVMFGAVSFFSAMCVFVGVVAVGVVSASFSLATQLRNLASELRETTPDTSTA